MDDETAAMNAGELLRRFRRQIESAARFIAKTNTDILQYADAEQQAIVTTLEYRVNGKFGKMLAKVNGFAIEQLFMQELKCDLQDWVKSTRSDMKRQAEYVQQHPPGMTAEQEADYRRVVPILCMMSFDRMTIEEVAAKLGISESGVDRKIAAEKIAGQIFKW